MLRVGLVGVGVVGKAFANALGLMSRNTLSLYDPKQNLNDDISDCDVVYVSVYFDKDNTDILSQAVEQTVAKNKKGLIVIRSTVMPSTTDSLIRKYDRPFAFMPEFLKEATSVEDALRPDKIVIGVHDQEDYNKILLSLGSQAAAGSIIPIIKMKPIEAEITKLACNMIRLNKVILADEIATLCEKSNADYYKLLEAFKCDWAINPNHLDPYHGGSRGAGGRCLPKDAEMLQEACKRTGMLSSIIDTVIKTNKSILGKPIKKAR